MEKDTDPEKNSPGSKKNMIVVVSGILLAVIAVVFWKYAGDGSHSAANKILPQNVNNNDTSLKKWRGDSVEFLNPSPIGNNYTQPPQVAHLAVTDLDKDGLPDVIVCDTKSNTVSWIRHYPLGKYTESVLANGLPAPAHVEAADFDNDGDTDLVVAVLGLLFPTNDKIGSVVILENDGSHHFRKHVIIEKIARVSDVRAGDLDGDGDMDLAVAQFGYSDGETRWIENRGKWKFESHILQRLSGPINVIITDMDKDGDMDIISLVSQEWEEIYCFINQGKGQFTPKLLWGSNNEDYGSSSIFCTDLDRDGDDDVLYTNGDSFNYSSPVRRPWHGIQWLENKGDFNFGYHRIADFPGAYNCRPADIDGDGDTDLFAVSGFNTWDKPEAQSFIWLENTGNGQFTKHTIARKPTHLITLETGDFDRNGQMDMITGGMYLYPPYDRMGRVTLWMNNGKLKE